MIDNSFIAVRFPRMSSFKKFIKGLEKQVQKDAKKALEQEEYLFWTKHPFF